MSLVNGYRFTVINRPSHSESPLDSQTTSSVRFWPNAVVPEQQPSAKTGHSRIDRCGMFPRFRRLRDRQETSWVANQNLNGLTDQRYDKHRFLG